MDKKSGVPDEIGVLPVDHGAAMRGAGGRSEMAIVAEPADFIARWTDVVKKANVKINVIE